MCKVLCGGGITFEMLRLFVSARHSPELVWSRLTRLHAQGSAAGRLAEQGLLVVIMPAHCLLLSHAFGIHTEVQLFAAQLLVLVAAVCTGFVQHVHTMVPTQPDGACMQVLLDLFTGGHTEMLTGVLQLELCS
jgi:hypothetical protein